MIKDDATTWPISAKRVIHNAFNMDWVLVFLGRQPRTVFDVGSWSGDDAMRLKGYFPSSRVLAFEACPQNYADMVNSPLINRIEVYHMAMCDKIGVTEFRSSDMDNCSGSILEPTPKLANDHKHLNFSPKRLVPCSTIEHFCACRGITDLDIVHMDVQGAEALVLKGMGALRPTLVYLETSEGGHYDGAQSPDELRALLDAMGYDEKVKLTHDSLFVLRGQ